MNITCCELTFFKVFYANLCEQSRVPKYLSNCSFGDIHASFWQVGFWIVIHVTLKDTPYYSKLISLNVHEILIQGCIPNFSSLAWKTKKSEKHLYSSLHTKFQVSSLKNKKVGENVHCAPLKCTVHCKWFKIPKILLRDMIGIIITHIHDNHIQVWGFFTFSAILAYCGTSACITIVQSIPPVK